LPVRRLGVEDTEGEIVLKDKAGSDLRIGVFICDCGSNIAGYLKMQDLVDHAKTLPNVSFVQENLYTCSEGGINEIKEAMEKNGFFAAPGSEIVCLHSREDVEYVLNSRLYQVILETTEHCNLRCKYCIYSGRYTLKRSHSSWDMPMETARKAVRYFMERSSLYKGQKPAITFYGGEPLLQFSMIREIVQYAQDMDEKGDYFFSFTTNGTLLTEEILSFLVKNDVGLLVSLDGPKSAHDRYRVFENGKGTFDTIMKNLKKIKAYDPDYFKRKISFAATIAPPFDYLEFFEFFYKDDFFKDSREKIRFNFVDGYETSFFKDFDLGEQIKKQREIVNVFFENYKKGLIENRYDQLNIQRQLFEKDFYNLVFRPMRTIPKQVIPAGACFPGQRRLFVSTAGDFYICERAGVSYKIGDVDKGFDFDAVYDFQARYTEFFKDCKNCWALRLCNKCYTDIQRGADFDEERKKKFCIMKLDYLEKLLSAYCEIIEENPSAFEPLKDIEIM